MAFENVRKYVMTFFKRKSRKARREICAFKESVELKSRLISFYNICSVVSSGFL